MFCTEKNQYYMLKKSFILSRLAMGVLFIVATFLVSCSSNGNRNSHIEVNDPHRYLSKELKNSLSNLQLLYPTRLEVMESLPFGSETAIIDSLWNANSTDILIVASIHPDYLFVRMSEVFDGCMSASVEGALGSSMYYETQLNDSLDVNQKVIAVINQLMNSESMMAHAVFIEYIKGEILSPLYEWTTSDDSWVYRWVYYPSQRPFVWMINLTGNYFVGMFLAWLILAGLSLLLIRFFVKLYLRSRKSQTTQKEIMVAQGIGAIIGAIVLTLPTLLGALSIGVQVSNTGVEFSRGLVENMGLSFAFVDKFYMGKGSQPSLILTILACLCCYLKYYKKENEGLKAGVITAALFVILLASSAAFSWAVFLFFLDGAIANSKTYYEDTYVDGRNHGVGKLESTMWMSLRLIVIIGAAYWGHWFAMRYVEIDNNRFAVSVAQVKIEKLDTPRPHVEEWFSLFDDDLKQKLNSQSQL